MAIDHDTDNDPTQINKSMLIIWVLIIWALIIWTLIIWVGAIGTVLRIVTSHPD